MSNIISNRKEDTTLENIMRENFNRVYDICGMKYIRCSDAKTQLKGSDLVTFKNGKLYRIDEKCATNCFDRDLQTFAFEISFIPCNRTTGKPMENRIKGWFINENNETDIYALGYVRANSKNELKANHITRFQVILIKKKEIEKAIANVLSPKDLEIQANKLIEDVKNGKIASYGNNTERYRKVLTPDITLCWSPSLAESPVNLLISKRLLQKYAFRTISFEIS